MPGCAPFKSNNSLRSTISAHRTGHVIIKEQLAQIFQNDGDVLR